jgi:hypothetical protein
MLARARGDDPSKAPESATRPAAEAVADETANAGGSAASPDAIATDTPASEIPDPAAGAPAAYNGNDAALADAPKVEEPNVVESEPAANTTAKSPSEPVQVSVSKPPVEPLPEPSRGWIIGVPVIGAALFMGVFWIILRAGPG